jgi:hypothetical protein
MPLFMAWRDYRRMPHPANELSGVFLVSLAGFNFLMLSVAAYSWGQQGYMAWILISLSVSYRRVICGELAKGLPDSTKGTAAASEYGLHAA